jgi:ribonuclease HI
VASKKFYAVKRGRKVGIFTSWNLCKASIEGFSGAEYKGFSTMKEAEQYINNEYSKNNDRAIVVSENSNVEYENSLKDELKTVRAYVDGSYSEATGVYSYGCVILSDDKVERLSGNGNDESATSMRNVAGELLGAMRAVKWAYENKYPRIIIYHDYEGIAKWITGEWKAKQDGTKKYVDFVMKYKKNLVIDFVKVLAHSGDKYNEEADKLAKEALTKQISLDISSFSPQNHSDDYLIVFKKVMKTKSTVKNQFFIKFREYEISESKLTKFIKEVWKLEGNDIDTIDSMKVYVDTNNFTISWLIMDKAGIPNTREIKFN